MAQRWPVYTSHADVQCFNCTRTLSGQPVPHGEGDTKHNPPGHGRYRQYCATCEMFTYYDVVEGA